MSPEPSQIPDLLIIPMTFVQTYSSMGIVMESLLENDATYQEWFGSSRVWRNVVRFSVAPLYYHWATSGYTAAVDDRLAGFLFLRGWRQILYIEALVTHPEWRNRGIGSSLLRFAEAQARALRREWLGLTATLTNVKAMQLYEKHGYQRGHWRIMRLDEPPDALPPISGCVKLHPVIGPAAERAYRRFTRQDFMAGDTWAATALPHFLSYSPHRLPGRDWIVVVEDKPVAYLNKHGRSSHPRMYLAAGKEWWGDDRMVEAIQLAANCSKSHVAHLDLRLGSSGHHDAACVRLKGSGFSEQPALTARMLKHLTDDTRRPTTQPGGHE